MRGVPRRHLLRLFAIGALLTLLVLPAGTPPVSDAPARLGVAHWLLTGTAPFEGLVPPDPLVLRDRHGVKTPWYGLGQSLVLLPADALATAAGISEPRHRFIAAQYLTFPIVNGLIVAAAALLLATLGFGMFAASAGALSLAFCSTLLWHFQNNQENTLQFLLVLVGLTSALRWTETGRARWLAVMGVSLGFDLLIRLPNAIDVLLVSLVPLLAMPRRKGYIRDYCRYAAPGIAAGIAADRAYHYARFGEWTTNYMQMSGDLARRLDLPVPPGFPFSNDFWIGLTGPFVSLQASVFLFDPLLVVLAAVLVMRRRSIPRLSARVASLAAAGIVLTAAGYARYFNWPAMSSWGDRFLAAWVWMACLLAVPLLIELRVRARIIVAISAVLLALQVSSIVFPAWLEQDQLGMQMTVVPGAVYVPDGRFDHFVIGQRMRNIVGEMSGVSDAAPMLPVMMPLQSFPGWLALLLRAAWCLAATGLVCMAIRLLRETREEPKGFAIR
jgi:hypothetical protein